MKLTSAQIAYGWGKCRKCERVKPLADFERWSEMERSPRCKECEAKFVPHPLDKKCQKVYDGLGPAWHRKTALIRAAKNQPCMDCGNRFPLCCMDFDHRGEKEYNIASMAHCREEVILAEIAKCDVVCACCHRIRTAKRAQNGRKKKIQT